jgi:hypothetical protein
MLQSRASRVFTLEAREREIIFDLYGSLQSKAAEPSASPSGKRPEVEQKLPNDAESVAFQ